MSEHLGLFPLFGWRDAGHLQEGAKEVGNFTQITYKEVG